MASTAEPLGTAVYQSDPSSFHPHFATDIPILPSTTASHQSSEASMDMTPSQSSLMGPPAMGGPNGDETHEPTPTPQDGHYPAVNGASNQPAGAAAAAQQPKVVQTAFIHKLYNMLEDQSIQHLISWSNSNDSFVMSPSSEFSKVLAQYFKHTNISSFVRQLNMYGFHKVSDVFHTGSPETPLWEFKHGAGNFKRGDLVGLREIKRRASRHALIHRDSFSSAPKLPPMPTVAQPGIPMDVPLDPLEARFGMLEWNANDLYTRLQRTEESYQAMTAKCQGLLDGLSRCHQWNQELCSHLLSLIPDADNPIHKDISAMRQDVSRHIEQLRTTNEQPQEGLFTNKHSFFQNNSLGLDLPLPLSPRQRPFDDSRRPSLQAVRTPTSFRPPAASQGPMSPRRYGSIGTGSGTFSPAFSRPNHIPPPPPPPSMQQSSNTLASPPPGSLARRHTSADIRVHGWQGNNQPSHFNQASSPYASGESSSAWPSSPRHAGNPGDQQLHEELARYELPRAAHSGSRQHSPPPSHHDFGAPSFASSFGGSYANLNDAGWQIPGARYPFKGLETPGPPTRRSSMASNVHSLLNPADTAEREGEDEGPDERKRKRV